MPHRSATATSLTNEFSVVYINDFQLLYPRSYEAVDDQLSANSAAHKVVTLDAFSTPDIEFSMFVIHAGHDAGPTHESTATTTVAVIAQVCESTVTQCRSSLSIRTTHCRRHA
jgi:hypothetical protein